MVRLLPLTPWRGHAGFANLRARTGSDEGGTGDETGSSTGSSTGPL